MVASTYRPNGIGSDLVVTVNLVTAVRGGGGTVVVRGRSEGKCPKLSGRYFARDIGRLSTTVSSMYLHREVWAEKGAVASTDRCVPEENAIDSIIDLPLVS